MKPAIVIPVITQLVEEGRALLGAVSEAEHAIIKIERALGETREAAKARRLELGTFLSRARAQLPPRGTKGNGWGAFLEALEISESTARKYMIEAGALADYPQVADSDPAYETPEPRDEDAPPEADARVEVVNEAEIEIDRDTWCTPRWITDAIGEWDLDPCANERSHVQAKHVLMLERGQDGLAWIKADQAGDYGYAALKDLRVFINPPYSNVRPWIDAYAHTRFCFLLKLDISTKWFDALIQHAELVLLPKGTRVEFEPPIGVPPEKAAAQPFPHALFYARAADATEAIRARCHQPWRIK